MARFQDLTHGTLPIPGGTKLPAYSTGPEDVYYTPDDIAGLPVNYDTVSGVSLIVANSDAFRVKLFTSNSAIVVTIPLGLTPGFQFEGYQRGQGRITFLITSGVTASWPKAADGTTDCKITRAPNSPYSFGVTATNQILFVGDLSAT